MSLKIGDRVKLRKESGWYSHSDIHQLNDYTGTIFSDSGGSYLRFSVVWFDENGDSYHNGYSEKDLILAGSSVSNPLKKKK